MPRQWVLIVDDDPLILQVLEEYVSGPQIRVTTASDALQAFIQARDLKPALIISDIQMGHFGTGDSTLREMRKDERLRSIPFIFISGMEPEKAKLLIPSDDPKIRLMTKPIDFERLSAMIFELTGLTISSDPA